MSEFPVSTILGKECVQLGTIHLTCSVKCDLNNYHRCRCILQSAEHTKESNCYLLFFQIRYGDHRGQIVAPTQLAIKTRKEHKNSALAFSCCPWTFGANLETVQKKRAVVAVTSHTGSALLGLQH